MAGVVCVACVRVCGVGRFRVCGVRLRAFSLRSAWCALVVVRRPSLAWLVGGVVWCAWAWVRLVCVVRVWCASAVVGFGVFESLGTSNLTKLILNSIHGLKGSQPVV